MMKRNERDHASCTLRVERDGRIFAHNLTPALAAVLAELNPDDETMQARAGGEKKITTRIKMKTTGATNDALRTTNA